MMHVTRSTIDTQALYAAIDRKRTRLGLSWREATRQITGGSSTTLGPRLKAGRPVTADMLGSIMMWLDAYDIRVFLVPFRKGRRYAAGAGGVTTPFTVQDDPG